MTTDADRAQYLLDTPCPGHDGSLGGYPQSDCVECLSAAFATARSEDRDEVRAASEDMWETEITGLQEERAAIASALGEHPESSLENLLGKIDTVRHEARNYAALARDLAMTREANSAVRANERMVCIEILSLLRDDSPAVDAPAITRAIEAIQRMAR